MNGPGVQVRGMGREHLLGKRINGVERLSDVECYILAVHPILYLQKYSF